jgi:hypothetical protein
LVARRFASDPAAVRDAQDDLVSELLRTFELAFWSLHRRGHF